jgi:hypothetical protein
MAVAAVGTYGSGPGSSDRSDDRLRRAPYNSQRDILRRAGSGMNHPKELAAMAEHDPHYDVIVVGSGFDGSAAALRATENDPGVRYPPYSEHKLERAIESKL